MKRELTKDSHWMRLRLAPSVSETELADFFAAHNFGNLAGNISMYTHDDGFPMCVIAIPPSVICDMFSAWVNGAQLHGHVGELLTPTDQKPQLVLYDRAANRSVKILDFDNLVLDRGSRWCADVPSVPE